MNSCENVLNVTYVPVPIVSPVQIVRINANMQTGVFSYQSLVSPCLTLPQSLSNQGVSLSSLESVGFALIGRAVKGSCKKYIKHPLYSPK